MGKPILGLTLDRIKHEIENNNADFLTSYFELTENYGVVNVNRVLISRVARVSCRYTDQIDGGCGKILFHNDEGTVVGNIMAYGRDNEAFGLMPHTSGDGKEYYRLILMTHDGKSVTH